MFHSHEYWRHHGFWLKWQSFRPVHSSSSLCSAGRRDDMGRRWREGREVRWLLLSQMRIREPCWLSCYHKGEEEGDLKIKDNEVLCTLCAAAASNWPYYVGQQHIKPERSSFIIIKLYISLFCFISQSLKSLIIGIHLFSTEDFNVLNSISIDCQCG